MGAPVLSSDSPRVTTETIAPLFPSWLSKANLTQFCSSMYTMSAPASNCDLKSTETLALNQKSFGAGNNRTGVAATAGSPVGAAYQSVFAVDWMVSTPFFTFQSTGGLRQWEFGGNPERAGAVILCAKAGRKNVARRRKPRMFRMNASIHRAQLPLGGTT